MCLEFTYSFNNFDTDVTAENCIIRQFTTCAVTEVLQNSEEGIL